MTKKTPAAQAVKAAKSFAGCDYWYCSSGEAGTKAWLDEVRRRAPGMWTETRYQNAMKQCDGKPKFDCVGLMRKATGNEKNATALNMNAEALRRASNPQPISTLPEIPGVMLFIPSKAGKVGHVGMYCGNGIVAEAHGFKRVDVWSIKNQKWEQWGFSPWVDYGDAKPAPAPEKPATASQAATTAAQRAFIERVGKLAQANNNGVLPSLTIAQAILESGWGTSRLAREGNALFGIKAGSNWAGKRTETGYRAFGSWEESIADHSKLLSTAERYKALVGERDYKKACRAVMAAGYCDAKDYADKLINIIERYGLTKWDAAPAVDIKVGDLVRFKQVGVPYFPGQINIPARLKGDVFTVIGLDERDGERRARLKEIDTWCAVENLERI